MTKLTVNQSINKSFILWGIRPKKLRIYYRWDLEKRKEPVKIPCIVVDYFDNKREWLIFYVTVDKLWSCTIDDITGTASITSFDEAK